MGQRLPPPAAASDVVMRGNRLHGQGLKAGDEKAQEPRESDTHSATDAVQYNPFHQQACDKPTLVLRDEVWLEALDELARTVAAVTVERIQ